MIRGCKKRPDKDGESLQRGSPLTIIRGFYSKSCNASNWGRRNRPFLTKGTLCLNARIGRVLLFCNSGFLWPVRISENGLFDGSIATDKSEFAITEHCGFGAERIFAMQARLQPGMQRCGFLHGFR